ncbi:hypothetical protein [Pedobacter montanisoli]|uniref:DUF4932 domain-containing protein n=1 Tax=Pedobacter montanisoli TaxID=2923277 RepID=A0ABS9ZWJ6_9SPHI|nr:hypothetical protein [Pedobacter montanisoli]MCJ0742662.1 hypothetical protein [Pedobacter montanisoli]
MKNKIFITSLFLSLACTAFAQKNWFRLQKDSTALIQEATLIKDLFVSDINSIKPGWNFSLKTTIKTTPMLVYYDSQTAHLPLWSQLPEQIQNWFYEIGENKNDGQEIFGLFFNGFYLPHELAHGFEDTLGKLNRSYKNEYFANTIAILWFRKHGYLKELEKCYETAKVIMAKTPNPVPNGQTAENFFTKNYNEILLSGNPSVYGFMQFGQFIKIYEDKTLPDFDTFIKTYLSN